LADDQDQERVQRGVNAAIPQLHANGFVNTLSAAGDIMTVFERAGVPVATLTMSYSIAKTLATSLLAVVTLLEERTRQAVLTTHELEKLLTEKKSEH
jgi:hypothetical protein